MCTIEQMSENLAPDDSFVTTPKEKPGLLKKFTARFGSKGKIKNPRAALQVLAENPPPDEPPQISNPETSTATKELPVALNGLGVPFFGFREAEGAYIAELPNIQNQPTIHLKDTLPIFQPVDIDDNGHVAGYPEVQTLLITGESLAKVHHENPGFITVTETETGDKRYNLPASNVQQIALGADGKTMTITHYEEPNERRTSDNQNVFNQQMLRKLPGFLERDIVNFETGEVTRDNTLQAEINKVKAILTEAGKSSPDIKITRDSSGKQTITYQPEPGSAGTVLLRWRDTRGPENGPTVYTGRYNQEAGNVLFLSTRFGEINIDPTGQITKTNLK